MVLKQSPCGPADTLEESLQEPLQERLKERKAHLLQIVTYNCSGNDGS